jgi:hypothetical protein
VSSNPATALADLVSPSHIAAIRPEAATQVIGPDEDGQGGWTVWAESDSVGDAAFAVVVFDQHEEDVNRDLAYQVLTLVRDHQDRTRKRVELVAGLRDFADFVEQHPDAPVLQVIAFEVRPYDADAAGFRAAVEALRPLGGLEVKDEKWANEDLVVAERAFGPVKAAFKILADRVCEMQEETVLRPVIPAWARGEQADEIAQAA